MMRNVIDLGKYFEHIQVTEEKWTDIDGSMRVDRFKEVILSEELSLVIYDDGSATLILGNAEYIFRWDDEVSEMFGRFKDASAIELFALLYRKRWDDKASA